MAQIKNIIFDKGGVILNIDYNLTAQAFRALGATDFDELYSQQRQCTIFDLYDTGKITSVDFRAVIKEGLKIQHVSDEDFDHAWNAMLLDLPVKRLELIAKLRNHYRVFVLSNTNEIHIIEATKTLQKATLSPFSLKHYFDEVFYSHECGLRKPDAAFFELVVQNRGLIPEETLFIDDSIQHIKGAEALGIQTLHLTKGCITEVLPKMLQTISTNRHK